MGPTEPLPGPRPQPPWEKPSQMWDEHSQCCKAKLALALHPLPPRLNAKGWKRPHELPPPKEPPTLWCHPCLSPGLCSALLAPPTPAHNAARRSLHAGCSLPCLVPVTAAQGHRPAFALGAGYLASAGSCWHQSQGHGCRERGGTGLCWARAGF